MLYIVATPIGNLKDITLRALEVLKSASLIACEDTRKAKTLLSHYDIHAPLMSYYDHNEEARLEPLLKRLRQGEDIALISDAGLPVFQDPGYLLTRRLIAEAIPFTVLPGPVAAVAALVLSGLPPDSFVFEGYLPPKKAKRQRKLKRLSCETRTVIFYETPHRLIAGLRDILEALGDIEVVVVGK
ncbi:MAG: 16S rRNA (cytidine(1402)-2'-O)-methyltransferase [Candidatus Omnitrophota bacterium]